MRIVTISHRLRPAHFVAGPGVVALAVAVGLAIPVAPLYSGLAAAGVLVVGAGAYFGWTLVACTFAGTLPWLVVYSDLLSLTARTAVSGLAAGALFLAVQPWRGERSVRGPVLAAGLLLFLPVLISMARGTSTDGLIQAARYLVFPMVILAVAAQGPSAARNRVAWVLFVSTTAALVVHGVIIAAGLGGVGTYYGAGERVGFAVSPHEVAFLAVALAVGAFTMLRRLDLQAGVAALAASIALATGVRAAVLALLVLALLLAAQRGTGARRYVVVFIAAGVIILTGAQGVTTSRLTESQSAGEFSSLSSAGSSRGAIWTNALDHYSRADPLEWVFGTGLRTIPGFSQETLGAAYIGHSDLIEVLVQLGLFGLIGLTLWWIVWARTGVPFVAIVVLAVFALTNGAIEWVGPLFAFVLLTSTGPAEIGERRRSRGRLGHPAPAPALAVQVERSGGPTPTMH